MSTTPRIEYKIEKKDWLAGLLITSYIIEDNSANCKIAKRHVERLAHDSMSNILSDAMYDYDNKIEFNIHSNGLSASIEVDLSIRYTISATHIEVFDDEFRKYRDYGITINDDIIYITNNFGKVIQIAKRSENIRLEDELLFMYQAIDAMC